MKRKVFYLSTILLFILIILMTGCSSPSSDEQKSDPVNDRSSEYIMDDPYEAVLSWTGDPKTTQTISWGSKDKYDGMISYQETGSYSEAGNKELKESVSAQRKSVQNGKYYRYSATINNLNAGTEYCYTVGSAEKQSDAASFTTESDDSKKDFQFMYMGDVQFELRDRDYPVWGDMLRSAYDEHPESQFVLQGGDMVVNNGEIKEWSLFFENGQYVFSRIPLMTVPGNHETSIIPEIYTQMMALPEKSPTDISEEFYSFDYGNCHFLMLNSSYFMDERIDYMGEAGWESLLQKINAWIKKDLERSNAQWNIVVMHHPIYPISDDSEMYEQIKMRWEPLFTENNVDLGFCGHQHVYMRTAEEKGITYIMSRSGEKYSRYYEKGDQIPDYVEALDDQTPTYQIISQEGSKLTIVSYDNKNNEIDRIILDQ